MRTLTLSCAYSPPVEPCLVGSYPRGVRELYVPNAYLSLSPSVRCDARALTVAKLEVVR